MYHPGKPSRGPLPFGPPRHHGPPYVHGGPCGPLPHLGPGPGGSFPPPDHPYLYDRPPGRHFIGSHCSNFPVDHSTKIALGGPPAEPLHTQVPPWNPTPVEHHFQDSSDRAGEEFLRCIAANKPLPNYLKGDMALNLAEAFKSANVLRDAVKSNMLFQSRGTRSKSRSRSRGRSRGKSRAKSCARSRSRGRSKSRAPSRSRGRSKSRVRGKSRVRSKSRSRSRSHGRGKKRSPVRSKSQVRRSKSRSNSREKSHSGRDKKTKRSPSHSFSSSGDLTSNSLLEGLKLVINSKELEERLPSLKDAILTIQGSDETKKVERAPGLQHNNQDDSTSFDNDSMLLPHERVVSDFSWLQGQSHEDSTAQKAAELEAEESFLYGSEDTGEKQASSFHTAAVPKIGKQAKPQEMDNLGLGSNHSSQKKPLFPIFENLMQPQQMTSSNLASVNLDSSDNEKIKNILKGLGTADISEMMVQGQKDGKQQCSGPSALGTTLSDPNVRQALESLQSLIKVTKEKRVKRDGSGTSQTSDKHKAGEDEDRKLAKQARMAKMEILMKELGALMKQDGLSFLTPVIGFYCQRCEEFIGDLKSAENHATTHHSNSRTQKVQDTHAGDIKKSMSYFSSLSNQHPADRRARSDQDHHRGTADRWDQDHHSGTADRRDQDHHSGTADRRDQDHHSGTADRRDQDHHSGTADRRDQDHHRGTADSKSHIDHRRDRRDESDHRGKPEDVLRSHRAKQENISLQEEMRRERMLITVSRGQALLTNVRVKGQPKKEPEPYGSKEEEKVNSESSDSSGDETVKSRKTKSPKKKKKKKDKKKKEKKKKKKS